MRRISNGLMLFILALTLLFLGCARFSEAGKLILGTSTKALEEARNSPTQSQSQIFNQDYPTIYRMVFNLLKKKKIDIFMHSQKKHRIIALHFDGQLDTTEVGIFFEKISAQKTKVTIASLSQKHLIKAAKIIFPEIEKSIGVNLSDNSSEITTKGGNQ